LLFNSYPFLFVFLPATLTGFFLLRRQRLRLLFIVAASYVFYAYDTLWFPALMAGSTAISFVTGRLLADPRLELRRKPILATGVAGALSLLAYFKYAQFVTGNASSFVSTLTGRGLPSLEHFTQGIALPIGISFYTFEAISYMVDVYRGEIEAERNPLRFAFFISFFPHLVAGPIVRYAKLSPQLDRFYRVDPERLLSGLLLFSLGLIKKVLIADPLGQRVDTLLAAPHQLGSLDAWAVMFAYAFQIYFDFAAYTDMALGLARIVGIELPWGFDRPYCARSPQEFWRRWNVTLSAWLRDYLYIPLGGNRRGKLRQDANVMATMGLGGLWHGASFSFAAWGLWQGGLLVAHRRLTRLGITVPAAVGTAITFVLVTIGWVFFRVRGAHAVGEVLAAMVGLHGVGAVPLQLLPLLGVCAVLMWGFKEEWRWRFEAWPASRLVATGLATGVALVLVNGAHRFIYFRF
jgi:alginate O-acetyltransferase complex protein AlgI